MLINLFEYEAGDIYLFWIIVTTKYILFVFIITMMMIMSFSPFLGKMLQQILAPH